MSEEGGGCCLKRQPQLGIRQLGGSFEGVVKPIPEVAVGKQVQTEQRHQSTEGQVAFGAEPEVFEQQHGDQCCPNLSLQGIGAGADEGLDLEMLFEYLEEEFDLPAIPVYPADSGRSELEVVGQKLNLPPVLFVPDGHPAQHFRILEAGLGAGEADDLVSENVPALGQGPVMYDLIGSIVFESGNKEDSGVSPLEEELKVVVTSIHSDDTAFGKRKTASSGDIASLAIGDHGEVRQIAVVIQQQVELNGAFGLTEVSPGKQAKTEVNDAGVKAE